MRHAQNDATILTFFVSRNSFERKWFLSSAHAACRAVFPESLAPDPSPRAIG